MNAIFLMRLNLEMNKVLQCDQMNFVHTKFKTEKMNIIPTQHGVWI